MYKNRRQCDGAGERLLAIGRHDRPAGRAARGRIALAAAVLSKIQLNVIGRDSARAAGGATALTDVTGYGLAVHASEMVEHQGLTVRLFLDRLPCLPGVLDLIDAGVKNRANSSNRDYLEKHVQWDLPVDHDPKLAELLFDPQTSGGLLIAVPPERSARMLEELKSRGAEAASEVGRIEPRSGDAWIVASLAESNMVAGDAI